MALVHHRICRDEYLQGELGSEIRHEYVVGNVYAMSGGTLNHQRVAANFLRFSKDQLAGEASFPIGIGFKLQVPLGRGEEAFYYPDGMIICVPVPGDALFTDSPSVVLEVLSPNTRRNDEVQKFRDYLTIPTLGTYILAETESPFLTLHRRDGTGFPRETLSGPDAILDLPEAGISIPLGELYRDVSCHPRQRFPREWSPSKICADGPHRVQRMTGGEGFRDQVRESTGGTTSPTAWPRTGPWPEGGSEIPEPERNPNARAALLGRSARVFFGRAFTWRFGSGGSFRG